VPADGPNNSFGPVGGYV